MRTSRSTAAVAATFAATAAATPARALALRLAPVLATALATVLVSVLATALVFGLPTLVDRDATLHAQTKPRARALGVPFEGATGPLNAITDVAGVEVGQTTLISGSGPLKVGSGPVRTGVTAVLPRGRTSTDSTFAGWVSINGNGEMTGTTWIKEGGFLEGPVFITNTHSVGTVRDAAIAWSLRQGKMAQPWALPVVAETYDGWINDINGFHVKPEHVFAALDGARGGPVAEGNVGGGTGMICHGLKCGIGTASRKVPADAGGYTVGILVQANHGGPRALRIAGVPVGAELARSAPRAAADGAPAATPPRHAGAANAAAVGQGTGAVPVSTRSEDSRSEYGSIIVVVATDAPLLPHQLERVARRTTHGIARLGATSGNSSGDIAIAFSTANPGAAAAKATAQVTMLSNDQISALFDATVQATEEAIVNALVAAETMKGIEDRVVEALPHAALRDILKKYNRLQQ